MYVLSMEISQLSTHAAMKIVLLSSEAFFWMQVHSNQRELHHDNAAAVASVQIPFKSKCWSAVSKC